MAPSSARRGFEHTPDPAVAGIVTSARELSWTRLGQPNDLTWKRRGLFFPSTGDPSRPPEWAGLRAGSREGFPCLLSRAFRHAAAPSPTGRPVWARRGRRWR